MKTILLLLSVFITPVAFITYWISIWLEHYFIPAWILWVLWIFWILLFREKADVVITLKNSDKIKELEELVIFNAERTHEVIQEKKQLKKQLSSFSKWSDQKIEKQNQIIKKLRIEKNSIKSKLKYKNNKK